MLRKLAVPIQVDAPKENSVVGKIKKMFAALKLRPMSPVA
jgi:hypothetical protein